MGASRKLNIDSRAARTGALSPAKLPDHLAAFLARYAPDSAQLCVALSGGVDSVVLLDIIARLRERLNARLSALHVNHALSPNAAAWEDFCAQQCAQRGVQLRVERVQVGATRGIGLEAAARRARYAAFARCGADRLLLAHHRDDQAETLLLRLLRGSGVRGLGAMRAVQQWRTPNTTERITLLRPLIMVSRDILIEYAKAQGLEWIEDESNRNLDLDRNFLRHEILPRLAARFAHYPATVARAAQHLQQASDLLDASLRDDEIACIERERLKLQALRALPPVRAAQVLRAFARQCAGVELTLAQTEELQHQFGAARAGAQMQLRVGDVTLRAWGDEVHVLPRTLASDLPVPGLALEWKGEARLALPAPFGVLSFSHEVGAGINAAKLQGRRVSVRSRSGGERMRLAQRGRTRTLKNLLQEARMPVWQRERLPLLFCDDTLVWVPGIGVAAQFQAGVGEPGVVVVWDSARETAT